MEFTIFNILILLIALEHTFICLLEMFFSQTSLAVRIFGIHPDFIKHKEYKVLMANQGLYNGFLAGGLFWALFFVPIEFQIPVKIFFISCVLLAGIFGGITSKISIFFKQGLPALIALIIAYL